MRSEEDLKDIIVQEAIATTTDIMSKTPSLGPITAHKIMGHAVKALYKMATEDTSIDGDIGHLSGMYPLSEAKLLAAGEVHLMGILTPHESLPVEQDVERQFLRIVSSGVHGREPYFTKNPLFS